MIKFGMISFLNPILLSGLLGMSIPIIIHLINRKKALSHKFAAIDFVLQSNKRISVKFKLRQLILLMLRAALIAFLALAVAKPYITNFGGGASGKNIPTSNVIILDDSYSMQYAGRNESFFATARNAARLIINNLTKDDNAAVILCSDYAKMPVKTGSEPQAPPELDYDKSHLLTFLEQSQPRFVTTNIAAAMDAAVEILTASGGTSLKRIFLLTDLTQNGWDADWFKSANEKLRNHVSRIHIVDVSEDKTLKNIAITGVEQHVETFKKAEEVRIKVTVSNFSPDKVKNLLAQVFINGKKTTQGFYNIEANSSDTKEFSFSLASENTETKPGKRKDCAGWIEIQDDHLNADNKRYFTINASRKLDILMIDGDPKTNIYDSETFYLEKALNPGRDHASPINPVVCSVQEVNDIAFERFPIIFFCNVETLPTEKIRELEKYVRQGGAVVFSMGSKVDAGYYNNSFGDLLPYRLYMVRTFSDSGALSEEQPLHLKTTEPAHPTIRAFSEADQHALHTIKFYRIMYVDPSSPGNCKTILSFSNDTPAVVERQVDKGKVVFFASSIDRDWTDLPVKPLFLPLIQQLCKYLAGNVGEEMQQDAQVKDAWQLPAPYNVNTLEITNPEGIKTLLQPQSVNNEKAFSFDETSLPGIYAVTVNGETHPQLPQKFAVNPDTKESNLDKMEQKNITALLGGTNLTITTSPVSVSSEALMGEAKKTLWGTILFFTLCILFA
ncbi:MAG: BatA domain-containing protein, partial [Planctomycetota bacterium]